MNKKAPDSWALIAWLTGEEPAKAAMVNLLRQAIRNEVSLYLSWISIGEVYYMLVRRGAQREARQFIGAIPGLPFRTILPDPTAILDAALLKSSNRISYADAFVLQTARANDAAVVTGDPEIRRLGEQGVCKVDWIAN